MRHESFRVGDFNFSRLSKKRGKSQELKSFKKADAVIGHLFVPHQKKLKLNGCLALLKERLPIYLRDAIVSISLRGNALNFSFKHPIFQQEFNYKIHLIKEALKELQKDGKCFEIRSFIKITSSVEFKNVSIKNEICTNIFYEEKATKSFENRAKSREMHMIFEQIRTSITE